MLASDLDIAERLFKGEGYDKIASELHVSPRRISAVKKLVEAASIAFDQGGKASYAPDYRPGAGTTTEGFSDYGFRAARILGVEDPKEALERLLGFAVKLNPYLLYYGVKKPEDLVDYFCGQNSALRKERDKYKNLFEKLSTENEFELARRMGLDERTLKAYDMSQKRGWRGTLADYLNEIAGFMIEIMEKKYEVVEA